MRIKGASRGGRVGKERIRQGAEERAHRRQRNWGCGLVITGHARLVWHRVQPWHWQCKIALQNLICSRLDGRLSRFPPTSVTYRILAFICRSQWWRYYDTEEDGGDNVDIHGCTTFICCNYTISIMKSYGSWKKSWSIFVHVHLKPPWLPFHVPQELEV